MLGGGEIKVWLDWLDNMAALPVEIVSSIREAKLSSQSHQLFQNLNQEQSVIGKTHVDNQNKIRKIRNKLKVFTVYVLHKFNVYVKSGV